MLGMQYIELKKILLEMVIIMLVRLTPALINATHKNNTDLGPAL